MRNKSRAVNSPHPRGVTRANLRPGQSATSACRLRHDLFQRTLRNQ
jgi:hypothetical protein